MQDLPVALAITGFTAMGMGAIAKPGCVMAPFGILELTRVFPSEPPSRP